MRFIVDICKKEVRTSLYANLRDVIRVILESVARLRKSTKTDDPRKHIVRRYYTDSLNHRSRPGYKGK